MSPFERVAGRCTQPLHVMMIKHVHAAIAASNPVPWRRVTRRCQSFRSQGLTSSCLQRSWMPWRVRSARWRKSSCFTRWIPSRQACHASAACLPVGNDMSVHGCMLCRQARHPFPRGGRRVQATACSLYMCVHCTAFGCTMLEAVLRMGMLGSAHAAAKPGPKEHTILLQRPQQHIVHAWRQMPLLLRIMMCPVCPVPSSASVNAATSFVRILPPRCAAGVGRCAADVRAPLLRTSPARRQPAMALHATTCKARGHPPTPNDM